MSNKSKSKSKPDPKKNSKKPSPAKTTNSKPEKEDVMSENTTSPAPETTSNTPAADTVADIGSTETGTAEGKPQKERKPMGTVQERLVEKAEYIKSEATLMLRLATGRGAPEGVVQSIQGLLVEADMALGTMVALKASDWQPTEKKKAAAPLKEVTPGAKIVVLKDHIEKYSYIPGLTEGTTLEASKVEVKGRFTQVLLKLGEVVYGWAPRSHVDLAP